MSPTAPGTDPRTVVQVWFCPNDDLDEETRDLLAGHWLDEHEREVAGRFVFERDRHQYLAAHVLVRRVLGLVTGVPEAEVVIWRSSRGRPFLQGRSRCGPADPPGPDFNLSHTQGYNAVAVAHGRRVGVDVERLDRAAERGLDWIEASYAPEERAYLASIPEGRRRDRATLRLWTLKEAYAKARGLGLWLPFDSFAFELADRGVRGFRPPEDDTADRWTFVELEPRPQVLVALAVERGQADAGRPERLLVHDGFPWGRAAPHEMPLPEPPEPYRDHPVLADAGHRRKEHP